MKYSDPDIVLTLDTKSFDTYRVIPQTALGESFVNAHLPQPPPPTVGLLTHDQHRAIYMQSAREAKAQGKPYCEYVRAARTTNHWLVRRKRPGINANDARRLTDKAQRSGLAVKIE
jgi:hypothetical protein